MKLMDRRRFLTWLGTGTASLAVPPIVAGADNCTGNQNEDIFVGVQIRPRSFQERSIRQVIDELVETVEANAVFLIPEHFQTWLPPGNQMPKGVASPESFWAPAPEAARKCAVRAFPFYCDGGGYHTGMPDLDRIGMVDTNGKRLRRRCLANPFVHEWWLKLVLDILRRYPGFSGMMYGHERPGPMDLTISGREGACFCKSCLERARQQGIDAEQARIGYQHLRTLVHECVAGKPPSDGTLVTLLRLWSEYPEILAWNRMWMNAIIEFRKQLYASIKSLDNRMELGWHMYHAVTFSPLFRADYDYQSFIGCGDWVKPSIYHDCAGARFRTAFDRFQRTLLSDFDSDTALRVMYGISHLDRHREPSLADFADDRVRPFSEDYVAREVRRGVAALDGQIPLYAGIGIDIPTGGGGIPATPKSVYKATSAALAAGAKGIMISRHLDEIRRENLAAAGRAVKEHKARIPQSNLTESR